MADVEPKPLRTGPTIRARSSVGWQCGFCRDLIEEDEHISYTEECGWVHAGCAEQP